LGGFLRNNSQLYAEYVGDLPLPADQLLHVAVDRDINARNDTSSPIVRRQPNGQLVAEGQDGWAEFDKLAKSLSLRIFYRHPLAVIETLPMKIVHQIEVFDPRKYNMGLQKFAVPALIVVVAAALCGVAGGLRPNGRNWRGEFWAMGIVLAFALITPLIDYSQLAIGTLFCYMGAIAILAACGTQLLVQRLILIKTKSRSGVTGWASR
jgi:hypothetical protein